MLLTQAPAPKSAPPVSLNPRTKRLLEGPVFATLIGLAAPTVALMAFQGIVSAGEAALVGRLGSSALAGVSLSFPLIMLMTTLAAGAFGGGVASGVARALGAGKSDQAGEIAGTALGIALGLGVATTVIMLGLGRSIYSAFGAEGDVLAAAVRYSNVMFLGAIPFWFFTTAASVLRGGGNASYPALVGAVGGVITLAVSPLVIFGAGPFPAFGLEGAAAAVACYNLGAALLLGRAVWAKNSPSRPLLRQLIPSAAPAQVILTVAIPSTGNTLLTNLTFLALTGLIAPFGVEAMAGYGAGGRLEYLLIPIVFGIGSALVPMVAASTGAGNHERVRQATRAGAALAAGICAVIGITAAIFPRVWLGLFTSDAAVIDVGQAYLHRVGPAYPFFGLGLALYFVAQGRGRVVQPLLAGTTRFLVAGVGGMIAMKSFGCELNDLFHLMAAGLALYGTIMAVVMRRELFGDRQTARTSSLAAPSLPGKS
jgi:putative MATE family efflux protein